MMRISYKKSISFFTYSSSLAIKAGLFIFILFHINSALFAQIPLWDTIPESSTTVPVAKQKEFYKPAMQRISYDVQNANLQLIRRRLPDTRIILTSVFSGVNPKYKIEDGVISMLQDHRAVEAAQIKLPNVLGDNMVLQRNSTSPIWGQGKPDQQFSVYTSWNGQEYPVKVDNNGGWRVDATTGNAVGGTPAQSWTSQKNT